MENRRWRTGGGEQEVENRRWRTGGGEQEVERPPRNLALILISLYSISEILIDYVVLVNIRILLVLVFSVDRSSPQEEEEEEEEVKEEEEEEEEDPRLRSKNPH